jgi:hypothetical protein
LTDTPIYTPFFIEKKSVLVEKKLTHSRVKSLATKAIDTGQRIY